MPLACDDSSQNGGFSPLLFMPPQPPPPPATRESRRPAGHRLDFHEGDEYLCLIRSSKTGKIKVKCSPCVRPHKNYISEPAIERFAERLGVRAAPTSANTSVNDAQFPRFAAPLPPTPAADNLECTLTYLPRGSLKRQRRSSESVEDRGSDNGVAVAADFSVISSHKMVQLVIGDKEMMSKWYQDAFQAIQQVVCRSIAKLWIKRIQPKKQSTNPYNGACPKDKDMPKDPNRTRPPYWPQNVQHKEPDHINREDRIALLVHLITHTPQPEISNPRRVCHEKMLTAKDLKDAIEERRNDIAVEKWEIIEEIIRVRTKEESLRRGEIILAMDLIHESRRVQAEPDTDTCAPETDDKGPDSSTEDDKAILTPTSAVAEEEVDCRHPSCEAVVVGETNRADDVTMRNVDTQDPYDQASDASMIKTEGGDIDTYRDDSVPRFRVPGSQNVSPVLEVGADAYEEQWYRRNVPPHRPAPHPSLGLNPNLQREYFAAPWTAVSGSEPFAQAAYPREEIPHMHLVALHNHPPPYGHEQVLIPFAGDHGRNSPYPQGMEHDHMHFDLGFFGQPHPLTLRPASSLRHAPPGSHSPMEMYDY